MIYVENDFYSNFNGAVTSNDDATVQNMLVDQISNLIANRRGELIEMFQKVGIPVSANPSNEELSNAIAGSLQTNAKLRVGLAFLIAKDNNILAGTEKKSRSDGDEYRDLTPEEKAKLEKKKNRKDVDWNKTADTVSALAGAIGSFASAFGSGRGNQFQSQLQNQSNVKAPNYSGTTMGDTPPVVTKKKSYTWLWITLGVVVVAGGTYIAYKKGMFKKTDVAAPTPTPAPAPVV